MRKLIFLAVIASVGFGAFSVAQDFSQKESELLRGSWISVAAISADGKAAAVAQGDARQFAFEFGEEKLVTKLQNHTIEGTYKLDSSKSPKEIDVVRRRGGQELLFKGIYAVESDRLRMCMAGAGHDRPKEFKPGEGIEFAVELKRVMPPNR